MKSSLTLLFFILIITSCYSQKNTTRIFDAQNIKQLYVDTDEVYKITIKTSKTDKVTLTSHAEGEYFNDISLNMLVESNRMILTSSFNEILQGGFDKLSAHKVFSLELTLEIPESIDVIIESNIASVLGSGVYKNLQIELQSGYCKLDPFLGDAIVNTYKGSIHVVTNNATIIANSRNGRLQMPSDLSGKNKIKLTSIDGDISVVKN
jgi:hypothetical protein